MNARHAFRRTGQAIGWIGLWLIITLALGYIFAGPTDRLLLLWPISLAAVIWWHRAEVASIRRTHASVISGWQAASELKSQHADWLQSQIEWYSSRADRHQADAMEERLKVRKIVDVVHSAYMDEVRSSWSPELQRSGPDVTRYLWGRVHRIEQGIPPEPPPADETVALDMPDQTVAVAVPEG